MVETNSKIILCRILGSDLPPRHHKRQTFANLKFILERETICKIVERRWILNRIWEPEAEEELLELLSRHNQIVHRIPFDREFYVRHFLDPSGLPRRFNPLSIIQKGPKNIPEVIAFEWIYRHKNLAAIALNSARNEAIRLGVSEARWVLPFDGNTFLREDGLAELLEVIRTNPEAKYLVIPMVRFFDNSTVLDPKTNLDKSDEPQIGFRADASERFNEKLRYGNMPKAELLIRLGVPGPWHEWPRTRWEPFLDTRVREKNMFAIGSWIARLSTGADAKVEASTVNRFGNRILAIANYCDSIDIALSNGKCLQSSLLCYGETVALDFDNDALRRLAASASKDSWSAESGSSSFRHFVTDIVTLALAYRHYGERYNIEQAADCARAWFLNSQTRVEPNVDLPVIMEGCEEDINSTLADYATVWPMLDALRILQAASAMTNSELQGIANWLHQFQDSWLKAAGQQAETERSIKGVIHDLVIGSVSAYLGDVSTTVRMLNRSPLRLHNCIEPFGAPTELSRKQPLHQSLFSLQQWFNLAFFGRASGVVDLWRCGELDRKSLVWALRFISTHRAFFSEYHTNPEAFDRRIDFLVRLVPQSAVHYEVMSDILRLHSSCRSIDPANGVPPLWDLLIAVDRPSARAVA